MKMWLIASKDLVNGELTINADVIDIFIWTTDEMTTYNVKGVA